MVVLDAFFWWGLNWGFGGFLRYGGVLVFFLFLRFFLVALCGFLWVGFGVSILFRCCVFLVFEFFFLFFLFCWCGFSFGCMCWLVAFALLFFVVLHIIINGLLLFAYCFLVVFCKWRSVVGINVYNGYLGTISPII